MNTVECIYISSLSSR